MWDHRFWFRFQNTIESGCGPPFVLCVPYLTGSNFFGVMREEGFRARTFDLQGDRNLHHLVRPHVPQKPSSICPAI